MRNFFLIVSSNELQISLLLSISVVAVSTISQKISANRLKQQNLKNTDPEKTEFIPAHFPVGLLLPVVAGLMP